MFVKGATDNLWARYCHESTYDYATATTTQKQSNRVHVLLGIQQ